MWTSCLLSFSRDRFMLRFVLVVFEFFVSFSFLRLCMMPMLLWLISWEFLVFLVSVLSIQFVLSYEYQIVLNKSYIKRIVYRQPFQAPIIMTSFYQDNFHNWSWLRECSPTFYFRLSLVIEGIQWMFKPQYSK